MKFLNAFELIGGPLCLQNVHTCTHERMARARTHTLVVHQHYSHTCIYTLTSIHTHIYMYVCMYTHLCICIAYTHCSKSLECLVCRNECVCARFASCVATTTKAAQFHSGALVLLSTSNAKACACWRPPAGLVIFVLFEEPYDIP